MKNVPQLRFAGFDGEWGEFKLSDLGRISAGGDVDKKKIKTEGKYPVIANGDFNNGIIGYYDEDYKISEPAVTISARGNIGTAVARDYPFTPVIRVLTFISDNNIYFMSEVFNRLRIYNESSGVPQLTSPQFGEYKIFSTQLHEQEKIGDLFRKIDALIEKQEGKVSKMEDFKKSMLQKMFPKKGELVPEFRFDGFDGEWEEISIGDKFEVTMGQSPNSENYTTDINAMILVQGNADLENGHVTPRIFTKEVTKTSKKGDILMTVRAPVGTLAVNEYDVVIGRGVCSIKGNTFLYYSLTNMNLNNYWNRFSSGSTFESINSLDIKNASLKIPSLAEQEKIGNFFKNLDTQIETEEKLLVSYKQMKKSLLQKMFV